MDCKELIEILHMVASTGDICCGCSQCLKAADAIKTLLAERDAAVEDLHRIHTVCMDVGGSCPECGGQIDELLNAACSFCRHSGFDCWEDDPKNENCCAAFAWRGPKKEG